MLPIADLSRFPQPLSSIADLSRFPVPLSCPSALIPRVTYGVPGTQRPRNSAVSPELRSVTYGVPGTQLNVDTFPCRSAEASETILGGRNGCFGMAYGRILVRPNLGSLERSPGDML